MASFVRAGADDRFAHLYVVGLTIAFATERWSLSSR